MSAKILVTDLLKARARHGKPPSALILLCFVRSGSSSGGDAGSAGRSASLPTKGLLPGSRELLLGSVPSRKVTFWSMVDGPYSPFSDLACLGRMGQVSKLSAALQVAGKVRFRQIQWPSHPPGISDNLPPQMTSCTFSYCCSCL